MLGLGISRSITESLNLISIYSVFYYLKKYKFKQE